jgi:Protein of unknown function (DUF3810)
MSFFKKYSTSATLAYSAPEPWIHKRSLIWIGSALVTLLLTNLLPVSFWERWYYQGIFSWIRQGYDLLLGWSPFPMVYVVLSILLVRAARWMGQWSKGAMFQVSRAVGGLSALVTIFYFAWGFNYGQVTMQKRLGFDFKQVTGQAIENEFRRATEVLNQEATQLPDRLTRDESIIGLEIDDHNLRPEVEDALAKLNMPHTGRVRVRQLWPKGFLLRWSTAGIYIPQAGEGNIDKGLLSVQKPFTIAHEMAHGYGVTDEGACNFIAWLACSQSRDQWVRFGGALTYWRYAAAEMPADSVLKVMNAFPPVVKRAITLVRANDKKYPDLMPVVRDAIYSSYLKHHGVKGGLRSYNEVVMMVQLYLESRMPGNRVE